MTTPARYPTEHEVVDRIGRWAGSSVEEIIQTAIDIEREMVAKDAGEVVQIQYRWKFPTLDNGIDHTDWLNADKWHKPPTDPEELANYETRALVVQNSAVKVPDGLIEALHRQRQVDEDGSECGVSRQAVEEAISILQSLTQPKEKS